MSDRLRERWGAAEVALNAWSSFGGPQAAGLLAAAGFDAVTVDLQHGEATLEGLGELVDAIDHGGAVPLVRIPWNEPSVAMRVLDLGARGVICPMVNSGVEAEAFVRSCRYPPLGIRSYGPVRGAFGTGRDQTERANEEVLAFAQIETAEGLEDVEAICAAAGLDGVYVGPADLSLTLGLSSFADLSDESMVAALDRVLNAAARHGVVAGIHAPSPDEAIDVAKRGFRLVGSAWDAVLMGSAAAANVEQVRAAVGGTTA